MTVHHSRPHQPRNPITSPSTPPGANTPTYDPSLPAQYIEFVGRLTSGKRSNGHQFTVLAGEGAPTVTDGFAKWNVIPRPQRVGMTVLGGYDPMVMDVPIMFDAVVHQPPTDVQDVEDDIQKLEWMGGRGILYNEPDSVGAPGQGDSPLVWVYTTDGHGNQAPLVPLQYQNAGIDWIVTNIAYDANPLRGPSGHRIRQKATVTLTQHVDSGLGRGYDSAAVRAQQRNADKGKFQTVHVSDALNTIQAIASHYANNPPAARQILEANKGRRGIPRSVNAPMRKGTVVKVPQAVIDHV
jgi:hypothetical protein